MSRVTPVHTALRNCMRDEGRPFGFGDQVADPKPPQAAVVKSDGGERCGNVGAMISAGKIERGERKQTASEASRCHLGAFSDQTGPGGECPKPRNTDNTPLIVCGLLS